MTSTTVRLAKEKGAKLYMESKFFESIQAYTIAIDNADANDNELHVYYSNRCACYLQISEYKEARNDAESCTMIKPTWSKGYSRLGDCHLKLKKIAEAIHAYERALELEPDNADRFQNLQNARNLLAGTRRTGGFQSASGSSARYQSTRADSTNYKQMMTKALESIKLFFAKIFTNILLFLSQISEQQKIILGILFLGLIFYFLSYSGQNGRRLNSSYSDRTDSYDTGRTRSQKRKYNDASFSDVRSHENINTNYASQNYRGSNYDSHGSYGFEGMSWMVWGGVLGGAYFLPPYFPDLLGQEYSKPFFGMSMFTFSMILNMLNNSMRGGRGRRGGLGGFGNYFNRRRY